MANTKITSLSADTSPTSDDLVVTVNDPAGTPVNRKVTATNLITKAHGVSDGVVKVASGVMTNATSGTDYAPATSGSGILKGNGSGGFSTATANTDYYAPKANLSATTSPGSANDNTQGYAVGSVWIDVTGDKSYIAVDVSTGAAVWNDVTASAGGGINNVVEDLTPQLGGDLDLNSKNITAGAATVSPTELGYLDGVSSAIQTQIDGKLDDSQLDDTVYGAGWNADTTHAPTKNAVYDKIELLDAAKQAADADLTTIAGLTATTDNFIQSKSSAWASRTPTQVTADLIAVVGDSGSGGTKGLVPAPSAGDAAANKYLKASGAWDTVVSGQTLYDHVVAASGGTHTTLQAALTAASAGDTIFVRSGTYALAATTSSALNNITIIGENPASSVIDMSTYNLALSGANYTIKNLGFTRTTGTISCTGSEGLVDSCIIFSTAATTNAAISLGGAGRHKATNNYMETTQIAHPQITETGGYCVISNNYIYSTVGHASTTSGIIHSQAEYTLISGNYIRASQAGAGGSYPLIYASGHNVNVVGNNCMDGATKMVGIKVANYSANVSGNRVSFAYGGIEATSSSTQTNITGNNIYSVSSSYYAIYTVATDTNISSNFVDTQQTSGTVVYSTNTNTSVFSNQLIGGQYSVRVTGGYASVTGNYLRPTATALYGISIEGTTCLVHGNLIYGVGTTGGRGIYINATAANVSGNTVYRGQTGIESSSSGTYAVISNNLISGAATALSLVGDYCIYQGNLLRSSTTNDITYSTHNMSNTVINNLGTKTSVINETKTVYMTNTSGGALAAGDVVVYKSVAGGNEITTTTTAGDDKVFGVVTEAIASTAVGPVQTLGKTTLLKVDGTTDIAIGDFLTTFTTAGIAAKATAGDMVFAVALEAYTTNDSAGVIDALLISPRLI